MKSEPELQTKQLNGRTVSLSTYWWATQHHLTNVLEFSCIHGVSLRRACDECNEEK